MEKDTLCVHAVPIPHNTTGAVSMPIYQSATFAHPDIGETSGYDYTRLQNPTREHLEQTVAALEHGLDAMAFSSGMAAISLLLESFQPGDHIITSNDLYGGSHRLFDHIGQKNGLSFTAVDTSDLASITGALQKNTRALYIETPTNPMMQVTDIKAAAEIARRHDLLVIVDNTFLTPHFQQPLELGADVVIHSGTKYLGGHNDTLAGFLIVNDPALSSQLRFLYKTVGSCLSPFDSWLLLRGIKTLALRVEKQQANALSIAQWLKTQPHVKAVFYVGLPEHPGYAISCQQASGFGSMISLRVETKAIAEQVLRRISLIQFAESLGGTESLLTYPMMQTHADLPAAEREAKGIDDCLLRLSVGIENVDDLIADLAQALA